MSAKEELTADEIALYDRQIRLWGMATQLRLRSTKILVMNLGAVGTECVKNLVLGGLNSIEILDDSLVKVEDFTAQFFLPNDESIVGQLKLPLVYDKIKELNPRVDLKINTNSTQKLIRDHAYLAQFDLIVATELTKTEMIELGRITRELDKPLYVGGLHGLFGYIFVDLIEHHSSKQLGESSIPRQPNTELSRNKTILGLKRDAKTKTDLVEVQDVFAPIETIFTSKAITPQYVHRRAMKQITPLLLTFALLNLPPLASPEEVIDPARLKTEALQVCQDLNIDAKHLDEKYIELFSRQAYAEYSPTAAVLGGVIAQEVIRYLGKKESPVNNVLILDETVGRMPIYSM
ncbi:uncharacterized protein LODBEIA_P19560 [Lodderomyces beijingensis]|uniref:Ubiquitin-like 1-activating enzyme E1A n=1 Tax=Lodderomyces beijingensis TaxID=1775926 RepID=A0ABP0ZJY6_9ASCO